MKKKKEQLLKHTKELFDLMGVDAEIKVTEDKENEALSVSIDPGGSMGLIIGNRGETATSIQTVLGMMMRESDDDWTRILVNVGDWRERNEQRLTKLADQSKERALQTGKDQPLYNLTPAERRIIHTYFSNDNEVVTESEGEGLERYLVVRPK